MRLIMAGNQLSHKESQERPAQSMLRTRVQRTHVGSRSRPRCPGYLRSANGSVNGGGHGRVAGTEAYGPGLQRVAALPAPRLRVPRLEVVDSNVVGGGNSLAAIAAHYIVSGAGA